MALKLYERATKPADGYEAAQREFKRAIELDSNFASAYSALSQSYNQVAQHALGAQFAAKAFELRDRVSG